MLVPLTAAGADAPGLEFVRRKLDHLIHFRDLEDAEIRSRFPAEDFWAPEMEPGDCAVFLNGTLHRTFTTASMSQDRLSVEYRFMSRR